MGRIIMIAILAPVLYLGAILLASEFGGEVVELETVDERGRKFVTSLWIVDREGDAWLRAGSPDSTWLMRVVKFPEISLTRDGSKSSYRAEVVEDYSRQINQWMREKYGRADMLISTIHDDDAVVAIRLARP